ncbi:glucokinase [Neobacillus niacini]|uniref:ROK family protein n=1 Tax=Neobacillus niacini TaxID=86668 RepID=UPI00285D6A6F|nr:ROK family protein [Neobacillus niacini]MDR7079476.1 glucokinase [Neobacillus niacini]
MNVAVFDIGGTFVKHALINQDGEIIEKGKLPTPKVEAQTNLLAEIQQMVSQYQLRGTIAAIGISSCGIIKNGQVLLSANIPGYTGFTIEKQLSERLSLPVYVENDVRCAGLGEMWKGSAVGKENFVLLTLGTGIGGAVVIDGKLIKGNNGFAGELGHMIIEQEGRLCGCGAAGCYEQYASTSALLRDYQKESLDGKAISGEEYMLRLSQNDPIAITCYQRFIDYIVSGLVTIAHFINPESIIIGGGIIENGDRLINDIRKTFENKVMTIYQSTTSIEAAVLKNDASIMGAAFLAFKSENMIE